LILLLTEKQKPNYKAFIPVGISFIGAGTVFMTAVNPGVGVGLMGVGIVFLIIGIKKRKQ